MSDAVYTAVATSIEDGRAGGRVTTSDGFIDLKLAIPRELGGPGGATNPEQLFAAGWSSCFHSALKLVAAQQKIAIPDSVVIAQVGLQRGDDGHFALIAELRVNLTGIDQETADGLVEAAHAICPYSVATRGNVPVALDVSVV